MAKDTQPTAANPQEMLAQMSKYWFEAYKTGLDMLLAISNAALASAQHLSMLQLATDVEAQHQNREALAAVAGAKDLPSMMKAQQQLSQTYLEGFMKYWSATAEMLQQCQADMTKVMAEHMGELGKGFAPILSPGAKAGEAAPFDAAIEAMRKSQEAMLKAMAGWGAAVGAAKEREK